MADDKQGRDDQADDEKRRQRERELEEARTRGDEVEPRDDPGEQLGDLDEALQAHEYPTTTAKLIEAYGDYEIETQDGWKPLDEVLAPIDNQTYDSADEVRSRIQGLIHRR